MLRACRRYDTQQQVELRLAHGRIAAVAGAADPAGATRPASPDQGDLLWVAPGLIDIQVNGYGGQEFSSQDLTPEAVAAIVRKHWSFGVSQLCPTLTTQSFEVLAHGVAAIDEACRRWPEIDRSVAGIHVEGPYITAEEGPRGAHPAEHCRPPDWDEFRRLQDRAGGRICLTTLSPEFAQAPDFIARATAAGVVVALGHLSASGDQIRRAVDAGARLSTHLGNGAHRQLRRHPNYLWDQLAEDRLWASLIVDGHHLPGEVVKTFLRAKGPERCLVVSDVSGLAGLSPGKYTSSGCELEILPDGRLVVAGQDQLLAGASLPIGVGVANLVRMAGLAPAQALDLASLQPARLLGLPTVRLEPGSPADLVLFTWKRDPVTGQLTGMDIRATMVGGQVVYQAPAITA